MAATFLDTQDEDNAMNGAVLKDGRDVSALLERLQGRSPFFFTLGERDGKEMLVGLGTTVGCAQVTDGGGTASIAVSPRPSSRTVEFLTGDTPTPVDERYLLPKRLLQRVITQFIEQARRSDEVSWDLV